MSVKVLVVEDDENIREMLKTFLEWIGCDIVGEAQNGIEAVKKYAVLQPDVVTMDLIMPAMNGSVATKLIIDRYPDANVIIFTSLDLESASNNDIVTSSFKNGAKDVVTKFSKSGIADAFKNLFGDSIDF